MVGRIVGWVFLVAGCFVLVRDFWVSFQTRHWAPISLGRLWFGIDQSSLYSTQAAVSRYIGVRTWYVIDALLVVWASVALIIIGMALLLAFRPRQDVPE